MQHQLPIDPYSMNRWRKYIDEEGAQFILKLTVLTRSEVEAVKKSSLERETVDATVQPKAISFPTDSTMYNRSRERRDRLARQFDIPLPHN